MAVTRTEIRVEDPEINRYSFDPWDSIGPCSLARGYASIQSTQDSEVYGLWCSPAARKIVEYAEGDVTVIACDSDDEFVEQVRERQAGNNRRGWGAHIDTGIHDGLRQRFVDLGLGDMFYPTQRPAVSESGVEGLDAATAGRSVSDANPVPGSPQVELGSAGPDLAPAPPSVDTPSGGVAASM
ncbi:hypothetical protein ACQP2U_42455 (plasmid) [Nocardia sp. CA-084685]|uniref:hypothetical protein n=1 Tax=Nocardia sp. CA-084685 TaxID=3239970 RepID=UPI003D98F711